MMSVLWRQKQEELSEFKVILVHIVSSRRARTTLSKKPRKEEQEGRTERRGRAGRTRNRKERKRRKRRRRERSRGRGGNSSSNFSIILSKRKNVQDIKEVLPRNLS